MKRWMGFFLLWLCWMGWGEAAPCRAEYQSRGKRDPFIPLLTEKGQRVYPSGWDEEMPTGLQGLNLEGIVFDPRSESYAILNGKLVREGDSLNEVKVVRIESSFVTVLSEGQLHRLTLRQAESVETPGAASAGRSQGAGGRTGAKKRTGEEPESIEGGIVQ